MFSPLQLKLWPGTQALLQAAASRGDLRSIRSVRSKFLLSMRHLWYSVREAQRTKMLTCLNSLNHIYFMFNCPQIVRLIVLWCLANFTFLLTNPRHPILSTTNYNSLGLLVFINEV